MIAALLACSEYNPTGVKDDPEPGPIEEETDEPVLAAPVALTRAGTAAKRNETVELDGTDSYDPDDDQGVLTFAWELVSSPEGSTATFEATDTARPTFSADTLGTYVASLVVTDEDGLPSTNGALTAIEVVPWETMYVTLSWDTTDLDMDLHLVNPSGGYFTSNDCFFANPIPDWGTPGDAEDDPTLDADSETGGETENVLLPAPDEGVYTIYAHYYQPRDAAKGFVTPSLRVEGEGAVIAEVTGPVMDTEGEVWVAGTLDWATLAFTESTEVTTHADLGGPEYNK
jgi:hypothetical protein